MASDNKRQKTENAAEELILYWAPESRASVAEWYLEEKGIKYKTVEVDIRVDLEKRGEEFLKANPLGQVPTLVDGDFVVTETAAVLLYLAEMVGELQTAQERAIFFKWTHMTNCEIVYSAFFDKMQSRLPKYLDLLEDELKKHDYITGDTFTVTDVALGSALMYITMMDKMPSLDKQPHVQAYLERVWQRPAGIKAMGPMPAARDATKAVAK